MIEVDPAADIARIPWLRDIWPCALSLGKHFVSYLRLANDDELRGPPARAQKSLK